VEGVESVDPAAHPPGVEGVESVDPADHPPGVEGVDSTVGRLSLSS